MQSFRQSIDKTIRARDGRTLGFSLGGDPNGIPLVFHHAWLGSRLEAELIANEAKKKNVFVIAIDRPGVGLSDYRKRKTFLEWTTDLKEIVDNLGIKKFSVAAVSGGAPYALATSIVLKGRINSITIVNGISPLLDFEILEGIETMQRRFWKLGMLFPLSLYVPMSLILFSAKFTPSLFAKRTLLSNGKNARVESTQDISAFRMRDTLEAFSHGLKPVVEEGQLYVKDWGFDLKNIKKNVNLWYTADDTTVTLKMGRFMHKHLPRSTMNIIPWGGHYGALNFLHKLI